MERRCRICGEIVWDIWCCWECHRKLREFAKTWKKIPMSIWTNEYREQLHGII